MRLEAVSAAAAAVAFASVVAVVPLGAGSAPAAPPERAPCARPPAGVTLAAAQRVLERFVDQAVLRRNVACSYELAAPALRNGLTREQWARDIPVAPFVSSMPRRVTRFGSFRVVLQAQIGAWVAMQAPDLGRHVYEIALVRRGGRWLVDYWGITVDPSATFPDPKLSA